MLPLAVTPCSVGRLRPYRARRGVDAMSKITDDRARALRSRPEVGRLRAVGGLTQRVLVDGPSLLTWCTRTGARLQDVLDALGTAADVGKRELVLVAPRIPVPLAWPAPHARVVSDAGVAELLRDRTLASLDVPAFPSVIVAGVEQDRQLLDLSLIHI